MDMLSAELWIDIGIAVLCGGIIGFERQVRGKPAGIRTSMLICLGTFLFIHLAVVHSGPQSDITRVLGQVVTGIGFLGAGVIIAQEEQVRGMTSAAVIWILAGIGAMIGFGHRMEAVVISLCTVLILTGIGCLESWIPTLRKGGHGREITSEMEDGAES
ncbi:MgtC/SapB family protein [bacterium]|nr:MgtC/SapB family protein [candidate division CSSED10-310 bacterium]